MRYCRIRIQTAERGCVYRKDFDSQQVFGPLVRVFAGELVGQSIVQEGEPYTASIIPQYGSTMLQHPAVHVDRERAQEPLPSWLYLVVDGSVQADTPLTFFTMELRFIESGVIYRHDMSILVLEHIWANLQTALITMHVLQPGDEYTPQLYFCHDNQVDFNHEEFHVIQTDDEPLIELVEVEPTEPALPVKSPDDFTPSATQTTILVSPVELPALDEDRQDDVRIYVRQTTYEALQAITCQDIQVEQGGVLVGRIYRQPDNSTHYLVEISDHIQAQGAEASIAELHYDFAAWQHMLTQLKTQHSNQQIVGWYHTHLLKITLSGDQADQTTDLFFSEHDRFMHRQFFAEPWYVALVLGAEGNGAFFRWFGDKISCNRQFYLI